MKVHFYFVLLASLFWNSIPTIAGYQAPDFGLLSTKAAESFDSASQISEALGLKCRDLVLGKKADGELDKLSKDIQSTLSNTTDGYLLKVQIYTDDNETPDIPGGQLLVPIGVGREPVLALAQFLRAPHIMPPAGLENSSYYLWVQKNAANKLSARPIPPELVPSLEKQAYEEARRRALAPSSASTSESPEQAVQRLNCAMPRPRPP